MDRKDESSFPGVPSASGVDARRMASPPSSSSSEEEVNELDELNELERRSLSPVRSTSKEEKGKEKAKERPAPIYRDPVYIAYPFDIMTFNIGRSDRFIRDGNPWAAREHILRKVILKNKPDLLLAQDVKLDQVSALENPAGTVLPPSTSTSYYSSQKKPQQKLYRGWVGLGKEDGASPSPTSTFTHQPIYHNPEKFTQILQGTFWLSETPDVKGSKSFNAKYPAIANFVLLISREVTNQLFLVYNIHLQHGSGVKARSSQCDVLLGIIKRHLRGNIDAYASCNDVSKSQLEFIVEEYGVNVPVCVIVGGTFNTILEWDETELALMRFEGFIDPYRGLNPRRRHHTSHKEKHGTYHRFYGGASSDKRDYIWVKYDTIDLTKFKEPGNDGKGSKYRPPPPPYRLETNGCWVDRYSEPDNVYPTLSRYPSDHYPLLARISLVRDDHRR